MPRLGLYHNSCSFPLRASKRTNMAENQGIELRELDRISLDPSNFEPNNQRYYITTLMYKNILILCLVPCRVVPPLIPRRLPFECQYHLNQIIVKLSKVKKSHVKIEHFHCSLLCSYLGWAHHRTPWRCCVKGLV